MRLTDAYFVQEAGQTNMQSTESAEVALNSMRISIKMIRRFVKFRRANKKTLCLLNQPELSLLVEDK